MQQSLSRQGFPCNSEVSNLISKKNNETAITPNDTTLHAYYDNKSLFDQNWEDVSNNDKSGIFTKNMKGDKFLKEVLPS